MALWLKLSTKKNKKNEKKIIIFLSIAMRLDEGVEPRKFKR